MVASVIQFFRVMRSPQRRAYHKEMLSLHAHEVNSAIMFLLRPSVAKIDGTFRALTDEIVQIEEALRAS
jgi:hypothetical protein